MIPVFPAILPSHQSRLSVTAPVTEIRFGDGRVQRIKPASVRHAWSLVFAERRRADIDEIDRFLQSRAGAEVFRWTAPAQTPRLFTCAQWDIIPVNQHLASLTAELIEAR